MNVSLTAELEAFVEGAVKSGRYGSASEAVPREGSFTDLARRLRKDWDEKQAALANPAAARTGSP